MTALYLGIDFGTSGCRACLIDAQGAVHGEAAAALPAASGTGVVREQDPALWWETLTTTLDSLFNDAKAHAVRAIAVDGTSATLLLADGNGRPLTPALLYNDARSTTEAARIGTVATPDSAARGATSSLAKLLHLQAMPSARAARYALHQADWINGCLSGRFGITDHNNALKLGYDAVTATWPRWFEDLKVPLNWLPEVHVPGEILGSITPDVARRFRFDLDTQVVCGTTDSTAACLAAGIDSPGDAVTSLGSTLVVKVLSPRPVYAAEYGVYSQPFGALWLVGGASNSGGAALRCHFSLQEIERLSLKIPPDRSSGLDYYPLAGIGERFPVYDPERVSRVTPRPDDNGQFLHGLLEGIARIELSGYRRLTALDVPYPRSVRTLGGGADNAAWTKIRASLLGVSLLPPRHPQAAYGAALLARAGNRFRP